MWLREREEGWEIKLRRRRERQIASALVCHLYDLSVRELVKLNSGVVWSWKSHFPIRAMESHINKLHKYLLYKGEATFFSNCAVKPEQGLVYVCDRVFTLSSAPIPSYRKNARPPTALLLPHYLSVYEISLMENMCRLCTCVYMKMCASGKCQPSLFPHYNQFNRSRLMSSRIKRSRGRNE